MQLGDKIPEFKQDAGLQAIDELDTLRLGPEVSHTYIHTYIHTHSCYVRFSNGKLSTSDIRMEMQKVNTVICTYIYASIHRFKIGIEMYTYIHIHT